MWISKKEYEVLKSNLQALQSSQLSLLNENSKLQKRLMLGDWEVHLIGADGLLDVQVVKNAVVYPDFATDDNNACVFSFNKDRFIKAIRIR